MDIETGLEFFREFFRPAEELELQRCDRVVIAGVFGDYEGTGPAVVVHEFHWDRIPGWAVRGFVEEISDDHFMTIAEDVCRDCDDVTNLTLDGKAASVDLRFDLLDTDSLVTRVVE